MYVLTSAARSPFPLSGSTCYVKPGIWFGTIQSNRLILTRLQLLNNSVLAEDRVKQLLSDVLRFAVSRLNMRLPSHPLALIFEARIQREAADKQIVGNIHATSSSSSPSTYHWHDLRYHEAVESTSTRSFSPASCSICFLTSPSQELKDIQQFNNIYCNQSWTKKNKTKKP